MAVPVDRALVGFVDTPVAPSTALANRGSVVLEGPEVLTVRDHVTLRLVYTVGHHGLDDRGAFKIVMRFPFDGGAWQADDPTARSYVSVRAERARPGSSGPADVDATCRFASKFESYGSARPWFKAWTSQLQGGCLAESDRVVVTLGDRSHGSPGLRLQTFAEDAWELRFLVDPCGTGHFVEVPGTLCRPVVPGPAAALRLIAPTRVPAGEPFWLGIKAEDAFGNPTERVDLELSLAAEGLDGPVEVRGLPPRLRHAGVVAQRIEGLTADPGPVWITARDAVGNVIATANPIVVDPGGGRTFWADLHGQSGETVGVNSARSYLGFARDRAFLDAAGHQANDFQISPRFWRELDAVVEEVNEPGRFVVIPGYEWSGNTAVGGDRNVYFRTAGRPIRRSSHALLLDRSEEDTDCTTARALFEALRSEDAIAVAHVGGRWADLRYAHDDRVERAVEIHSDWGTFEWLVHDAFAIGARVGIVANSDGHKGRPGASWPGASTFGAYGGLTCLTAPALTRDALFDALRAGRTVATTGARLDLQVRVLGAWSGGAGPGAGAGAGEDSESGAGAGAGGEESGAGGGEGQVAVPGDVVATDADRVRVEVAVTAQVPVHSVVVRVGVDDVLVHHPAREQGRRIAVRWAGAHYRGRGREVSWVGSARFTGARVAGIEPIALWNPDLPLELHRGEDPPADSLLRGGGARETRGPTGFGGPGDRVDFRAITTGNFGGFDAALAEEDPDARLRVETNHGALEVALGSLTVEGVHQDLGGLGMRLSVMRLADRDAGSTPFRAELGSAAAGPKDVPTSPGGVAAPAAGTPASGLLSSGRHATVSAEVPVRDVGDTPIWVCVTLEDGHQAWSSPIYLHRRER